MKLIAIVEGHGDVEAVRVLLRRVLQERLQRYDVAVERSIDQAAFASRMDLDQAQQCPSFDKFVREIRTPASLLKEAINAAKYDSRVVPA